MKKSLLLSVALAVMLTGQACAASSGQESPSSRAVTTLSLDSLEGLSLHRAEASIAEYKGSRALKVRMNRQAEEEFRSGKPSIAWLPVDFTNGVIEVEMAGTVAPDAPPAARGFIGAVFRIGDDMSCEGFYLRPTNGRAEDQVRRNHSTQYFSPPEYDFDRLRRESPEKYESYADLVPGEWTKVRIEVNGDKARLFVHGAEQPCLVVNDLKRGANAAGGVGLWVGPGTEGYFRNLSIEKR